MKNLGIIAFFIFFLFTGCEKGIDNVKYDSKVYLPTAGVLEIKPLLGESIYELTVYRSGINTSQKATIDLLVDKDVLAQYSDRQATILPDNMYSVEPRQITFEKDEYEKKVFVHFKMVDELIGLRNYVLPVSLSSIQDDLIIKDKKTTFFKLNGYRNQFEGKYRSRGKFYLKYNEQESEKIDYILNAETVSTNSFKIPSHINNMSLLVEVNGNEVIVSEASNANQFRIQDMGSSINGEFSLLYQRFHGFIILSYSYELDGRTYEANLKLNFDL